MPAWLRSACSLALRFSRLKWSLACSPCRATPGLGGEGEGRWRGHANGHLNLENLEILENSDAFGMPTLESVENLEFGKVQILEGGRGGPFELIPSSEILKGERDGRHEVAPASWKTGTQRDRETERERHHGSGRGRTS